MTKKESTKKVRTSEPNEKTVTEKFKEVSLQSSKAIQANDKRLYTRFVTQIDKEYKKMENCYLNTAFALHALYSKKLYQIGDYQNIYELASDKFSIARGTCNNFINICEKFGLPNESGTIIELQDTFKPYSMSQLIVMLNMPQELLNTCSPDMTVKALKELKNDYIEFHTKEIEQLNSDDAPVSMNEPTESEDDADTEEDYSSTSTDGKLFVCSATTYDELIKLKDIISEALDDVKKDKKLKDVRLELNIVF